MRRRNACGTSIIEFPIGLSIFLFVFLLPACNLVLFSSAYLSLEHLTKQTVQSMAMSDSIDTARSRGNELLSNYKNPFLTMLHQVKLVSSPNGSACKMSVVVKNSSGLVESYELKNGLPRNIQPDYGDNRNKLLYAYRLQVSCVIYPVLNLSGIPLAGQIPIIGGPSNLEFSAQAVIENPDSLKHS